MPTSNLAIWPDVVHLVHTAEPHRTVLDVGPGHGKAAVLLREYLNDPPERIVACEAWSPYVVQHRLGRLYDDVWRAHVQNVSHAHLAEFDVVLMVDVIEHIPKDDALDVLARIPGWVVICTPVEFFDNGPGLPPTEDHVSHWTEDDWTALADRVDVCYQQLGGWLVRLRPTR